MSTGTMIAAVLALAGVWLVWRWIRTITLVYRLVVLAGAGWLGWQWLTSPDGPHLNGGVPGWILSPLLAVAFVLAGGLWAGWCRRTDRQQPQPEKTGVNVKS